MNIFLVPPRRKKVKEMRRESKSSNFEIIPANSYRNPQRQGNLRGPTIK
jgi:hypothetical protein